MKAQKKTRINKDFFKYFIKSKGYTINSLGKLDVCSEKTIQRALKSGMMTTQTLNELSEKLNIHPKLLSGELYLINKDAYGTSINEFMHIIDINEYTYNKYRKEKMASSEIDEKLKKFLEIFNISHSQFQELDFEQQYHFQYELFTITKPLLKKFFKNDLDGNSIEESIDELLFALDDYKSDHDYEQMVDIKIRKMFLKSPPNGYTRKDISEMSIDQLANVCSDYLCEKALKR